MNTEEYQNRPKGKPSERILGRLVRWEGTDYVEFQPQGKKETATRKMMKETKNLSFYRNEGQKDSSYSLHVNVSGDSEDPAADIMERVQQELAPLAKTEPKMPTNTKFLRDTPELKVWHRKKDKRLCCHIEIDTSLQYLMSGTLLKLASEINKIITLNRF